MKMEQTECSETSAHTFHTPGNHPKESIQLSVHGESLKSRRIVFTTRYDPNHYMIEGGVSLSKLK